MTISHFPIDISFAHRRQSLSCRRHDSLHNNEAIGNPPWDGKVSPMSRIGSGWNRASVMDTKSDTLFAAFPVELRVEIFLQFCGMYTPIGKDTEGPILLLRVCRAWRELVLQTPQLWTSFVLDFRPSKQSAFLISTMKKWIDHSRNLPFSFRLHYPVSDATCAHLIQSVLPSSARWRGVSLHAPGASYLPLWEAKPNSFPSLRTLSMETIGPCPFVLGDLGINWAAITELDLCITTFPTLDECVYILKEGVNLKRFSMHAICVFRSNDPERLSLPKLEQFQLTVYGGDNRAILPGHPDARFLAFMSTLSLPGLESLKIGWNVNRGPEEPYYWSDARVGNFVDFLEGIGFHLNALHLECLPFDTGQILRCLEVVPSLRQVAFTQADREHEFINRLLGALTQQSGSSGLLPLLQGIRLESDDESLSNPVLLRFIASRWRYRTSGGYLESVDLVSRKRRAEYRPRWFKDLKEGRLDVAARLKSEFRMVEVLSSFLNKDSYETLCFLNCDFPLDIRQLLIFG